jgi:hypothetical protein
MARAAIYFLRTWFWAPENGAAAAASPPQSKSGAGGRWWRGIFAGDAGLAGEKRQGTAALHPAQSGTGALAGVVGGKRGRLGRLAIGKKANDLDKIKLN